MTTGPLSSVHFGLKPGTQPESALAMLRTLMLNLRNLPGELSGRHDSPEYTYNRRDQYLQWVENAEQMLSNHTDSSTAYIIFATPRYGRIRDIDIHTARPIPLINSEIEAQHSALQTIQDDLARRLEIAVAAPGHITVLDTNTLEHFQLPDSIDWQTLVAQDQVRLVIPSTVIDELDRHKHGDSKRLRERARNVLPKLLEMVAEDGFPRAIREGVTLELLVEPAPDAADADGEILAACTELALLAGRNVTLVTDDTRLRLRARRASLHAIAPPESASRNLD
jgi:rRNA-processing protein FCF1